MLNALTIDLEDYFQVYAFSKVIRYQDWEKYESRVERNAHRLLEILSGSTQIAKSATRSDASHGKIRIPKSPKGHGVSEDTSRIGASDGTNRQSAVRESQ